VIILAIKTQRWQRPTCLHSVGLYNQQCLEQPRATSVFNTVVLHSRPRAALLFSHNTARPACLLKPSMETIAASQMEKIMTPYCVGRGAQCDPWLLAESYCTVYVRSHAVCLSVCLMSACCCFHTSRNTRNRNDLIF